MLNESVRTPREAKEHRLRLLAAKLRATVARGIHIYGDGCLKRLLPIENVR